MADQRVFTLINQQNGHLAFKLFWFEDNSHFDHLQHNNYYSLIWVKTGSGLLRADFSEYLFGEDSLFAFAPYQPFLFSGNEKIRGIAIQFHSDFYCIHRNPKETNCDTTLFNNLYRPPFFKMDKPSTEAFVLILGELKKELESMNSGDAELLVPYLKILLIKSSRLKMQSETSNFQLAESKTPFLLTKLKSAIEENFKEKHTASDYAEMLNISPGNLSKIVKTHFQKTLMSLITERIIIEAKRELYMTHKPVKEIAWHLGYSDEFYFSRVFKNYADVSPQVYRDTVGFGKAEG